MRLHVPLSAQTSHERRLKVAILVSQEIAAALERQQRNETGSEARAVQLSARRNHPNEIANHSKQQSERKSVSNNNLRIEL